MIELHQYHRVWRIPNPGPQCVKVETYLRMTGLVYKFVPHPTPARAPRRTLPYLVDGDDVVSDRRFIIDHLRRRYGDPLDGELNPRERATGQMIARSIEEFLYWIWAYEHYLRPHIWRQYRRVLYTGCMNGIRQASLIVARRRMSHACRLQGIGTYTADEVAHLAHGEVRNLCDMLGEQRFFLGARATSVDATAFALLGITLFSPLPKALKAAIEAAPALVTYCERMRRTYFPELLGDP
jgi:glutathione S-transferase